MNVYSKLTTEAQLALFLKKIIKICFFLSNFDEDCILNPNLFPKSNLDQRSSNSDNFSVRH
jgi:hypothetical protein